MWDHAACLWPPRFQSLLTTWPSCIGGRGPASWRPCFAQRARVLLLAAEGISNTSIAERVGVSRPTVIACRRRYVRRGLQGLPDRPRPGRPQTVRRVRRAEILSVTLNPPPPRLGITHWPPGTSTTSRSPGPSPPTRSWPSSTVTPPQRQSNRHLLRIAVWHSEVGEELLRHPQPAAGEGTLPAPRCGQRSGYGHILNWPRSVTPQAQRVSNNGPSLGRFPNLISCPGEIKRSLSAN